METRTIDHGDGHIDTESNYSGVWVVTKCNFVVGQKEEENEMNWIDLKVEKPQPETAVIVTDGAYVWTSKYYPNITSSNEFWACHGYSGYDMEADYGMPTHWMPLPVPPVVTNS